MVAPGDPATPVDVDEWMNVGVTRGNIGSLL